MFPFISKDYYKNSVYACVVYDITIEPSFENIKKLGLKIEKRIPKNNSISFNRE